MVFYFIVQAYEKAQRALGLEAEDKEPPIEEKLNATLERLNDILDKRTRRYTSPILGPALCPLGGLIDR